MCHINVCTHAQLYDPIYVHTYIYIYILYILFLYHTNLTCKIIESRETVFNGGY